jgi:hypothetical protein
MKSITEVSVELENKPGTLSEMSELLGSNGINILALAITPKGGSAKVRIVAGDPARVENIMYSAGYAAEKQQILAVKIPDHPNSLNAILKPLRLAGVNVESIYTCMDRHASGGSTIMMLGVDELQKAHDALSKEWIQLYGEELYEV